MSEGVPGSDFSARPRKGAVAPLGALLRTILKENGVGREPAFRRVLKAWTDAVGSELAVHTKVAQFTKGVVVVEVDSAPLLHELAGYMKRDLLQLLRQKADAPVSDLKFRLGKGQGR